MFIWPKSKPWSPGAHLSDCPGFDVLFCSPAHLDRTFNETQADLIPGHFPLDQYIRLHEPDLRIMRWGGGLRQAGEEKQENLAGPQGSDGTSNLIILGVTFKIENS